MKVCFKCKNALPLSEFYKHKMMADGHLNKCKECTKKDVHNHRHNSESRERILAYDRARGNRLRDGYMKEYKIKYTNKHKAHCIVANAIKSKKLFKKKCEVCGTDKYIHAHHDNYLEPLNVRWLCASHHHIWHAENGEALNP